jgi:signal transduction histidine kinase
LTVRDDGDGIRQGTEPGSSRHLGLTTMDERARAIGGRIVVTSVERVGTTVALEVPIGG